MITFVIKYHFMKQFHATIAHFIDVVLVEPSVDLGAEVPMLKTPCLASLFCLVIAMPAIAAGTFHVDNANPSCSDTGPGTESIPYCTISAALDQQRGPGTTILVHEGTYFEQVTVPSSGDATNRLVIRALGPSVVVDGADDFSNPDVWEHYKKKVWQAPGVAWQPKQVFLNGTRLTPSTRNKSKLRTGEFLYVPNEGLYVNVGGSDGRGDNPGTHDLRVSRRTYGFRLSGRSWVTVDGFTVRHTQDKGINVQGDLQGVSITNNTVTRSGASGISVLSASNVLIASNVVSDNSNHGIAFVDNVTGSTIEDNESFRNARPEIRAANGIYLFGSSGNRIQRNRMHHNQDTGLELARDANDNLSLQNVSWSNEDHGFDCVRAARTTQIGNVAWGNVKDGFSIEGDATQTTLVNCIAVDNGLESDRFNLYVDSGSLFGFTSDHNIYWNSTLQEPLSLAGWRYESVEEFALVSGLDQHSIQDDPMFVDPATGNFRLRSGSPAIDSGDASLAFWPSQDAEGLLRFDDPSTPNTGTGVVPYADRGAHEYLVQTLAVGDDLSRGSGISLSAGYPNPSRAGVTFDLLLPRPASIEWSVHDLQGRRLWHVSEERAAGRSVLRWDAVRTDGVRAQPGLYFVRVAADGGYLTRPVILIR